MNNIDTVVGDVNKFLDKVFENLSSANIDVNYFKIDHIAYRATTQESFNKMVDRLEVVCKKLFRNTIRNRYIDIYELQEPIIYNNKSVNIVELIAPAEGDLFKEGLEHVEFIIESQSLTEFMENYPTLQWKTNDINKEIGPDIGLKFDNGANIKFKLTSIEEMIRLEKQKQGLI